MRPLISKTLLLTIIVNATQGLVPPLFSDWPPGRSVFVREALIFVGGRCGINRGVVELHS